MTETNPSDNTLPEVPVTGLEECFEENNGFRERSIEFGGVMIYCGDGNQEGEIRAQQTEERPLMHLFFSLEGICGMVPKESKQEYILQDSQHTVSFAPSFEGEYFIRSPKVRHFGVSLTETFFRRLMITDLECLKPFWEDIYLGKTSILANPMPVTNGQNHLIHEIVNCSYPAGMRKLYYESKIVELFLLQVQQAESFLGQKPVSLKPSDADKLYAVKTYVEDHLFQPITLEQIAKENQLNDFKLKKGFKEMFGKTVFGYINELRMQHARQMLLDTSSTVYEVADTLGYSEPHNFSKAFKKHYGYLPGTLKK